MAEEDAVRLGFGAVEKEEQRVFGGSQHMICHSIRVICEN